MAGEPEQRPEQQDRIVPGGDYRADPNPPDPEAPEAGSGAAWTGAPGTQPDPTASPESVRRTRAVDRIIRKAVQLAASLDHPVLDLEHLLIAMTLDSEAGSGFEAAGVDRRALRASCLIRLGAHPVSSGNGATRQATGLALVLDAAAEALRRHAEPELRILSVEELFAALTLCGVSLHDYLPSEPAPAQTVQPDRAADLIRELRDGFARLAPRLENLEATVSRQHDGEAAQLREIGDLGDRILSALVALAARPPPEPAPPEPKRRRWFGLF